MAALITLFLIFMSGLALSLTVPDSYSEVKVKPGEDAILLCRGHRDAAVTKIVWSRADLESDDYVSFFRENRPYVDYQHPSFQGRVELHDPEMKDGNFSLILKNVKVNDTGTYRGAVSSRNRGSNERNAVFTCVINLTLTGPGHTAGNTEERGDEERGDKEGGDKEGGDMEGGDKEGGNNSGENKAMTGVIVGLSVVAVFAVLVIIVGIKLHKRKNPHKLPAYTEVVKSDSLTHERPDVVTQR